MVLLSQLERALFEASKLEWTPQPVCNFRDTNSITSFNAMTDDGIVTFHMSRNVEGERITEVYNFNYPMLHDGLCMGVLVKEGARIIRNEGIGVQKLYAFLQSKYQSQLEEPIGLLPAAPPSQSRSQL
jgi:hypothetical protein